MGCNEPSQTPIDPQSEARDTMFATIARFFQDGGPMMWVILGVLALAVAVIVERLAFYLRTSADDADELAVLTARRVTENDLPVALDELGETGGPARRLMRRAVEMAWEGGAANEVRQAVEESALREMPRYGRRLNYLAMLANVATLAGLLGTIFGLQQSFGSLAVAAAADKASVLAAGIFQRVHFAVQDSAALLHPAIVSAADNTTVVNND